MTILNIAVGEHDIAIATCSRQSTTLADGSPYVFEQQAVKCSALPLCNALIAHSGGGGVGSVVTRVLDMLLLGALSGDVVRLAANLPEQLRAVASQRKFSGQGRFVLAGIVGEKAHAFLLDAPTWEAQAFPQGAWCQPSLRPPADCLATPKTSPVDDRPPTVDLTPPPTAPNFRVSLHTIYTVAEQQHAENPYSCGGPLLLSQIDSGLVIRQQVLRTLGET